MRYQDPSDVSCGVQALGMALQGVAGDGLESPASSALLGFLQGNGMMYDFGTGVEELAYAAGSFGFKGTQPFHGWSLDNLRAELAEARPVVVALGSNGADQPGHFVTVTGMSDDGRWISYNDPTRGKVTASIEEFQALWAAQGKSGVSVRAPGSLPAGAPDNLPLLALMAGLMALVSATPLGVRRQGVGGRISAHGGGANSSAPPYPAPAGKRWRAKTVPVYETKTVQDGWTTVSRQVPIKEMVREQVGTRTYYEKIPRFKTVSVQRGYKWVPRRVPKYRTVRYVRYYRTSWRRLGWRWVRRRTPVYGTHRVRAGSRTVWRKVPKYVKKEVPDGFHTIKRSKPVYALKEKVVGYKTVEKRVPRMVEKREQVGTKTEWKLEKVPQPKKSTKANKPKPATKLPAGPVLEDVPSFFSDPLGWVQSSLINLGRSNETARNLMASTLGPASDELKSLANSDQHPFMASTHEFLSNGLGAWPGIIANAGTIADHHANEFQETVTAPPQPHRQLYGTPGWVEHLPLPLQGIAALLPIGQQLAADRGHNLRQQAVERASATLPKAETHLNAITNASDFISGGIAQFVNDVSLGAFTWLTGMNLENGNDAFQSGRNAGRTMSNIAGAVELAIGASTALGSLSLMGPTGGGTAACAATTGPGAPICLTVGGLSLAVETAGLVVGGSMAAHGGAVVANNAFTAIESNPGSSGRSAYDEAREGGKHHGLYDRFRNEASARIRRAIRSYRRTINEHLEWINNPKIKVSEWDSLPEARQEVIIQGWRRDIRRNQEQLEIMEGILRERGQ